MSSAKNSYKSKKLKKCSSLSSDKGNNLDQEYKKVQRGRSAEQLMKIQTEAQLNKNLNLEEVRLNVFFVIFALKNVLPTVMKFIIEVFLNKMI